MKEIKLIRNGTDNRRDKTASYWRFFKNLFNFSINNTFRFKILVFYKINYEKTTLILKQFKFYR